MGAVSTPRKDIRITPQASLATALQDRRVAVVGGTAGIGRALAKDMAKHGASVTIVGRTFRDEGTPGIEFINADLSTMGEARRIGQALPADLDFVFFTTGILAAPKREETSEGLERDMAVSYLSRLAILLELAPRMASASRAGKSKSRLYVMGFPGMGEKGTLEDLNAEKSYAPMSVHMNTVAGNEALVLDFARRFPGLVWVGLNPGLIKSGIRGNFLGEGSRKHRISETLIGLLMMSAEQYAERILPVILSPDLEKYSPVLFNNKGTAIKATPTLEPSYVSEFVRRSEELVKRALEHPVS